ncbi:hypothetical protein F5Y05DRAFT_424086 [Hypoxylon sp. FL0543]|nr:hypothetical protein F5Y05DRAFT_424086 [Hypoxylon sp. FL0543]
MADALGFVLDVAGAFIPLGFAIADAIPDNRASTIIQIMTGNGNKTHPLSNGGGNVPHVAIWDQDGNRLGQVNPGKKAKIDQNNDPKQGRIEVMYNQNGGGYVDPGYILLSQQENDAICIASVQVSNGAISSTFYGDTGYSCGQSWFYSSREFGDQLIMPKCVWLDGDHTNKINAKSISWHINDLVPTDDKIAMFNSNPDYLCKSTPRFSFWGDLLPDSLIPFFEPQLEYNRDAATGGQGADVDPDRALDKKVYDKSVQMYLGGNAKREPERERAATRPDVRPRNLKRRGNNHDPSHLVVSSKRGHSARELCEHPNSYGWDFVSTTDGLYCDMETKRMYPVCDHPGGVTHTCFDVERRTLVGAGGINARGEASAVGVPVKRYESHDHWQ